MTQPSSGHKGHSPGGIVVFGGMGQVGQAVARQAGPGKALPLGRRDADLTDHQRIDSVLDELRPRAAVNAVAFQPVDLCEEHADRAFAVNALAAGMLAAACERRGVRLIHMSTDYVFDGERRSRYAEDDCPAPLSVYAGSKLAGEHLVLAAGPRHCVVRTSSVYGTPAPGHGSTPFVARMLERARAGETTQVVDDQVVSPTYAEDLGMALCRLVDADAAGLFHIAGGRAVSWYEIAERVFSRVGRLDLLSRTTAAEFGAPAPRPAYSALRSDRWSEIGIEPLPGIDDGLERYFAANHPELG